MTLMVSGGEFVTAFNRIQFVARETLPPVYGKGAVTVSSNVNRMADEIIAHMRFAQVQGWPLAQCVIDKLRAAVGGG